MSVWNVKWIDHQFDNDIFTFPDDGTRWQLGKKISEKAFWFDPTTNNPQPTAESQAVYHCRQVEGPSIGMEAIIKIRMQVPPKYPASRDPEERAKLAITYPGKMSKNELLALQHLTERGCSASPKLLTWFNSWQSPDMLVPRGYIMALVMEKLPGEPLSDFWQRPFEERERIRAAFRRAGEEFYTHYVYPADEQLGNILYDPKGDRCYILDFEDSDLLSEEDGPGEWADEFFCFWGLARNSGGKLHL